MVINYMYLILFPNVGALCYETITEAYYRERVLIIGHFLLAIYCDICMVYVYLILNMLHFRYAVNATCSSP